MKSLNFHINFKTWGWLKVLENKKSEPKKITSSWTDTYRVTFYFVSVSTLVSMKKLFVYKDFVLENSKKCMQL